MAATSDVEALYRAAVAAHLDQPENSPQVRDIARTYARLTGVLAARPRGRRVRIELDYDGDRPPTIYPWRGIWGELD